MFSLWGSDSTQSESKKESLSALQTQSQAVSCSTGRQLCPVKCISTRWAPVHLFCGPPSQEPTPCPISDLWGHRKCQLCAVKAMSQCWHRTQRGRGEHGRKSSSSTRTSATQMTSCGGSQQFIQVLFNPPCVYTLWALDDKTRAPGYSLSVKGWSFQLALTSWTEREHFTAARVLVRPAGSPGLTGRIAEVLLLCWTTCLV